MLAYVSSWVQSLVVPQKKKKEKKDKKQTQRKEMVIFMTDKDRLEKPP